MPALKIGTGIPRGCFNGGHQPPFTERHDAHTLLWALQELTSFPSSRNLPAFPAPVCCLQSQALTIITAATIKKGKETKNFAWKRNKGFATHQRTCPQATPLTTAAYVEVSRISQQSNPRRLQYNSGVTCPLEPAAARNRQNYRHAISRQTRSIQAATSISK